MSYSVTIPPMAGLLDQASTAIPLVGNSASGAMLALGIALMLVILLRRSGKYVHKLKRQAKRKRVPSVQQIERQKMNGVFDRASPLLDAPATVVRWQVEMQELARDLKAEIDTKARILEVLIRRSAEATERLEAAASRAERLGCLDRAADSSSLASLAEAAGKSRAPRHPVPPYAEQVYALADAGRQAGDIADELGLPLGDVEFALSLLHTGI